MWFSFLYLKSDLTNKLTIPLARQVVDLTKRIILDSVSEQLDEGFQIDDVERFLREIDRLELWCGL